MPTARSSFKIDDWKQDPDEERDGLSLTRATVTKTYSGALRGTSRTELVMCGTPEADSRAYVALERVDGSLDGKTGSFLIHHSATEDRGERSASWTIVPDSGVGELTGIAGKATIEIVDGDHGLILEYEINS